MRWPLLATLVLLIALAGACGNGGGSEDGPTDAPQPTSADGIDNGANGGPTSLSFEEARDALVGRIEAIGVNIGVVPDDIKDDILASCRELDQYADPDAVAGICDAISRAIAEDDPGLIQLVLNELDGLEPE